MIHRPRPPTIASRGTAIEPIRQVLKRVRSSVSMVKGVPASQPATKLAAICEPILLRARVRADRICDRSEWSAPPMSRRGAEGRRARGASAALVCAGAADAVPQ